MYFLNALMNQNNDLTQQYDLNIVILIDGLEADGNDFICPFLNFYQTPSYLALVRYIPAAMSVFVNALPNIRCKLYVAPASSLVTEKGRVGIHDPLLLGDPALFHNVQRHIDVALGPKNIKKDLPCLTIGILKSKMVS